MSEQAAANDATRKGADLIPVTPRSVLIVDDEELVRELFTRFLQTTFNDLELTCAVNGRDAMELFKDDHHGVVILDAMMPILNGEQTYDKIQAYCAKHRWQTPQVIFCSGFVPSVRITQIVNEHHQTHSLLAKPVHKTDLINAVTRFL